MSFLSDDFLADAVIAHALNDMRDGVIAFATEVGYDADDYSWNSDRVFDAIMTDQDSQSRAINFLPDDFIECDRVLCDLSSFQDTDVDDIRTILHQYSAMCRLLGVACHLYENLGTPPDADDVIAALRGEVRGVYGWGLISALETFSDWLCEYLQNCEDSRAEYDTAVEEFSDAYTSLARAVMGATSSK